MIKIIVNFILAALVLMYVRQCVTDRTLEIIPEDFSIKKIFSTFGKSNDTEEVVGGQKDGIDRILVKQNLIQKETIGRDEDFHNGSDCTLISTTHSATLIKSLSDLKHMNPPAQWSVSNNTSAFASVILVQNNAPIAVVFLTPSGRYESKIPSSGITFYVRFSANNCLRWKTGPSLAEHLPGVNSDKSVYSKFNIPIFHSNIYTNDSGVHFHTKFIRYTD